MICKLGSDSIGVGVGIGIGIEVEHLDAALARFEELRPQTSDTTLAP